jgi:hypothetical protein
MPNVVKYTTDALPSNCLKKGNFAIGNNTGDYGLTFYNGITPPSGGYTIYLNKASGGPSIYCPTNDSQLITITNQIASANYTTAAQCLNYFAGQSDKICVNRDYEGIVTNGLVLNLDAGFIPSYPTTGTTWYDLTSNGYNGTLTNGPGFSTSGDGCITFDGTNDESNFGNILNYTSESFTFNYWVYFNSLTTNQSGQGPVVFFKGQFQINGYYIQVGTDGSIYFITNQPGQYQATSTSAGTISINTWYNISINRNGASCKIYVNGVDRTTTSGTHQNPLTSSESFKLANYNNYIYANMRIAIFQSYNRQLSATEVLQNYNAYSKRFLDSDVKAYYNAVLSNGGTITDANLAKITSFILYLRDTSPNGNSWQYLDRFWMYKNTSQQAALTSIKNPTSTMSETVNNPTFTANSGYTLNGTSQYIKSKFIPSTDGVNYTFSALTIGGVWQQVRHAQGTRVGQSLIGGQDSTNQLLLFPNNFFDGTLYNLNRAIGGAFGTSNTSVSSGRIFYFLKRNPGFPSAEFYRNNNSGNTGGVSGGGTITKELYIGAYNNNDSTVGNYWGIGGDLGSLEFIFFGGNGINMSDLAYAITTYLV